MSLATIIAPNIPYLRRYSRALCGSQESGDTYVAAVLESLVADSATLPGNVDPRVGLFRVFSLIWQSLEVNLSEADPETNWEKAAGRKLSALTPLNRQAFLLVSVENFTTDEAAFILGLGPEHLALLIEQVSREIACQIATDVLIIEDEPLIAMEIESLVEDLGHRVIGIARTQAEAVTIARNRCPGLVLADIQLADGSSGLDAVNDILDTIEAPIIFITAFPEKFLTGERPEPAFLISKPFMPDTVKALISQALFFDQKCTFADRSAAA